MIEVTDEEVKNSVKIISKLSSLVKKLIFGNFQKFSLSSMSRILISVLGGRAGGVG